jgi:hypothetical protein
MAIIAIKLPIRLGVVSRLMTHMVERNPGEFGVGPATKLRMSIRQTCELHRMTHLALLIGHD